MCAAINNILYAEERLIHFEYDIKLDNFLRFLPTEAFSNANDDFSKIKEIIKTDIVLNQKQNPSENYFKDNIYHLNDLNMLIKITYFPKTNTISGIARDASIVNKGILDAEQLLKTKDTFIEINHAIVEMNNINDMFDFVLDKVTRLFNISEYSSILKLHPDGYFRFISSIGYDNQTIDNFTLSYKDSIEYQMSNGNFVDPIIIGTFPMNAKFNDFKPKYASTEDNKKVVTSLLAPIHYKGSLYGMICIDSTIPDAFKDEHMETMKYVGEQLSMIVEKQLLFEKILNLSKYDSLTKLLNRNQLENEIHSLITRNQQFAFANIDLNGLKYINDTYGHNAGDIVLSTFANELLNIDDTVSFRLGGDEFAVIFENTSVKHAGEILSFILHKIESNNVCYENQTISYSFSYGITEYPSESNNYESILKTSDSKMYTFKKIYKDNHL